MEKCVRRFVHPDSMVRIQEHDIEKLIKATPGYRVLRQVMRDDLFGRWEISMHGVTACLIGFVDGITHGFDSCTVYMRYHVNGKEYNATGIFDIEELVRLRSKVGMSMELYKWVSRNISDVLAAHIVSNNLEVIEKLR